MNGEGGEKGFDSVLSFEPGGSDYTQTLDSLSFFYKLPSKLSFKIVIDWIISKINIEYSIEACRLLYTSLNKYRTVLYYVYRRNE